MMKKDYKGLDNIELTLIHARFISYFETLNKNLSNNVIYQTNYTNGKPHIITFRMTDDQVKAFKESDYYKTTKSIVDKLKPIAGLIISEEPKLPNILQL